MNLLLDTCALIWLAGDPSQLSPRAAAAINEASSVLYISHASLWELTLKYAAGKLHLPEVPRAWWNQQVAEWGLIELPLTAEALLQSSELPLHHKDPFDRVILAQAGLADLAVVSPDHAFPAYGLPLIW